MKKISLLLVVVMLLSLAASVSAEREFVDSTGRTIIVPDEIDKVAVSGPMTQIILFALCPEKFVGISSAWDETAALYLPTEYYELPILGQLYGGKGELNLETLLASGAQVVLDVGEAKKSVKEDMDALQEQTGIPFIHIDASTETMGDAYRMLGDLLGNEETAHMLGAYCDDIYARMSEIADSVEKKDLLYITGEGHNVIAQGSYHAEIIDLMANNIAVVDEPSSKGTGNEVDMEQILAWDPEFIIFSPESVYDSVAEDETWQSLQAIQNGNYVEVPFGPYNWMGFPPSVQRYLGMMWMAKVLYPEAADYDLYEEVRNYYDMFYHCSLSEEQFNDLMAHSLLTAVPAN